jgi:homoserine kinase
MYKVNVSVPAVSTNIGPGYDVLGLALNLRNVTEMSLRSDAQLRVRVTGEGEGVVPETIHNPAMRAAVRLFQAMEQAPAGLNVVCTNMIPLDVGLSAHVAMTIGGLVGANNLLGSPFSHDELIAMAAALTGQPEAVVTAMRGGLGLCSEGPDGLIYRSIEIMPLRVVVVVPLVPGYKRRMRDELPARIPLGDAVFNMGHTALLIEALRAGDVKLLRQSLRDRLHEPYRRDAIPGYRAVAAAAEEAGAIAVTLSGAGPALLAFATFNHQSIESAIHGAFRAAGVEARTVALSSDSQGVVISVVE